MKESGKTNGRVSIVWSLVFLFGDEHLSREFDTSATERLAFPLIQGVQAGGVTSGEREDAITDKRKPAYLKNPRVSVQVVNYWPFFILGEIKLPGSYPYVRGMTVVTAVALAGGYTYRARAYVTRAADPGKKKKQVVDPDTQVPWRCHRCPRAVFSIRASNERP